MGNIDQAAQLNKLLEEQANLYNAQEASLKNQLNYTRQLVAATRDLDLGALSDDASSFNKAMNDAAASTEGFSAGQQTMESVRSAVRGAVEESDDLDSSITKLGKGFLKLAPVAGTLEGIVGGFNVMRGAMGTILSVGSSVFSTLLNIGSAIIMAPFKMLNALMGAVAGGGGADLRKAFEELRAEFGDLASNESQAVIKAWRSIDHFGGRLAETGLSIWRTMGNMAETMRALTEIAKNMGVNFSNLSDNLAQQPERLFAYVKGLHLSEDAVKAFAETAYRTGISIQELGRDFTQMAFGMGKDFGINGALISRDMGEMISDFENFGNLATRELGEVAVFARKLGVEVKALLGVVDTFDNFEDAATAVAQLSQAFGTQLDTLDLMNAQNPAERIEMLRKSFFAAGQSVENMTRQERALLASHTGLNQETLKMVFAQKNAGISYDDIQKKGKANEKSQISQAEAMQTLAGSIERLVKSGGGMQGGFFDIFFQGFLRGVKWTKEFHGIMWRLRRAMREVRWAGIRVGRAFVKAFPGVKEFLTGIKEIFDRRQWRGMTRGVVQIFRNFFDAIAGNNPNSVKSFIKSMQENFFNWFSGRSTAGRKVIDGMKKFSKAFIQIAGQMFAESMKGLGQAFRGIADFIRDPSAFLNAALAGGTGFLGFVMSTMEPAFKAIKEAWPELRDGFMELLEVAWQKIEPLLQRFLVRHLKKVMLFAVGPSLIGGALRGVSAGLGALFVRGFGGALSGSNGKKAMGALSKSMEKMSESMNKIPNTGNGGISSISAGTQQLRSINTQTRGFGIKEATALGAKLVVYATALAVGGVEFAIAIGLIKGILSSFGIETKEQIGLPLLVLGSAAVAMIVLSLAAKGLNPTSSMKMAGSFLAAAGALSLGGVAFAGAIAAINYVLTETKLNSIEKIVLPFLVLGSAILGTIAMVALALMLEPTTVLTSGLLMFAGAATLAGGGWAFIKAIAFLSETMKTSGLDSPEKVAYPILTVAGAAVALAVMAATIMAMALVANPLVLVAGLIGMAVVIGTTVIAVEGLLLLRDALKGFTPGDVENITRSVGGMALIYGAAATFALGATALGIGILLGGGGLGLLVGLGTLAVITSAGVEHVKKIINDINDMPSANASKLKTFTTLFESIANFAGSIGGIISSSSSTFTNIFMSMWGHDPYKASAETLGMVSKIIDALGSQIGNIIITITDSLRGVTPGQLDSAEKIAPLMSAIGVMAKAFTPDSGFTEGLFGDMFSVGVIAQLGVYMLQASQVLTRMFPAVLDMMQQIGSAPTIDEGKVSSFSSFMSGISGLMKALSPSGGMMSAMAAAQGIDVIDSVAGDVISSLGGTASSGGNSNTKNMLLFISVYARTMMSLVSEMMPSIVGFIGVMSTIAMNLDETKIKSLEVVSGIFESVIGLVVSLSATFSSEEFIKSMKKGPGFSRTAMSDMFGGIVTGIIGPISTILPRIIDSLSSVTNDMDASQVERLSATVEMISSVIGSVGLITEAVNQLGESEGGFDRAVVSNKLGAMGDMIGAMFTGETGIISALKSLGSVNLPRRTKQNAIIISEALKAVSTVADVVNSGIMTKMQNGSRGSRGIDALHTFMQHMFNPNYKGSAQVHYLTTLSDFGKISIPRRVKDNINNIKEVFNALTNIDFEGVLTSVGHVDDQFSENIRVGVTGLINSIKETGDALQGLGRSPMNLRAELQRVNNSLGLRGSDRLTIRQQPVTLNINFTVTMDAEELSRVIVGNESSRIIIDNAIS